MSKIIRTHVIASSALVLFFFLVLPRPSNATPIVIFGDMAGSTAGLGDFQGTLTYTPDPMDTGAATLEIVLTNTTPLTTGGFLTAFALNNPGGITGITLDTPATFTAFRLLGSPSFNNGVDADPFGNYDFGASATSIGMPPGTPDWLAGGTVGNGMPAGSMETFTFNLTGTALNLLNELSFVHALPTGMQGECCDEFMVVRFRGIPDPVPGGETNVSDKVPTNFVAPVPEPSTMFLLASGLVGLVLWNRRRKS